tara:strand:- start:19 stop:576 length:558 start_codon:yes stop_codon:yes gene_type:complete
MHKDSPKYNYSQLVNLSPPKRYNKKIFKAFLKEKQFYIINKDGYNKPKNGLWSSTYHPDEEYISDWIEWCATNLQECWIGQDNILLDINRDSKIFRIDEYQDLKNLYSLYPNPKNNRGFLDYAQIKNDWDIIWLTMKGQYETHWTEPALGFTSTRLDLYGWDSESSLILNNVVDRFKKITTRKRR